MLLIKALCNVAGQSGADRVRLDTVPGCPFLDCQHRHLVSLILTHVWGVHHLVI